MATLASIKADIDKLIRELNSFDPDKSTASDLNRLREEYKRLKDEISTSPIDQSKIEKDLKKLDREYTKAFSSLSATVGKTSNMFEELFGEFSEGVNHNTGNLKGLTTVAQEFIDVFSNFGENIKFWRDYDRRIREVGVSYGISGNRLEDFRKSNIGLEKEFISLGGTAEGLKDGIEGLYETTNQTNQVTKEFVDTLGGIKLAMGVSEVEAGRIIAQFNNLNVSFETTGKILNDLRNTAEKSALNTNKVLKIFSENFEKINTYSFKNGIQGMTELVKQSVVLKLNMDNILKLSDDFTDPEKTMEFASNMQLLGGSFAQLGDFNKLMYDAAVAPEELAKNIAKSTASLGEFDRATGKFSLSFADKLQLKEASKAMGISTEELNRMSTTAAKIKDIKVSLNFKDLTDEQYDVLGAMAQFDPSRGEYTVKMIDEKGKEVTRSIAELSDEDIQKISATKETESLKSLVAQKFDAVDMTVMNLEIAKYTSPDTFKGFGGTSEELKNVLNIFEKSLIGLSETVKDQLFIPLENFASSNITQVLSQGFTNATDAAHQLDNGLNDVINTIKGASSENVYQNFKDSMTKNSTSFFDGLKTEFNKEMILQYTNFKTLFGLNEKKSEGDVLKGPSHEQGGIPFIVNGMPGFEAEGNEIILTKGVFENPQLRGIASELNEMGGGKKLSTDQGILEKTLRENTSIFNKEEKIIKDGGVLKNDISNIYNNLKNFKEGDVIESSSQNFNTSSFINNMLKNNMVNNLSNIGRVQGGGLVDRRGDIMDATVNVKGNVVVDGNVSFTPIKVTIDGLSGVKELNVSENVQKEIYRVVEQEINKMSLYTKFVTQKGTGVNDGKSVNIPGITTNI